MVRSAWRIAIALAAAIATSAAAAEPIEWRVVNRYRLFDEAVSSRSAVNDLLDHLAEQRRQGRSIADSYDRILQTLSGPQAADLRTSNWTASDRVYDSDYLYPEAYRIEAWLTDPADGKCRWLVGGVEVAEAECRETVTLPLKAGPLDDGWGGRGKIEVLRAGAEPLRRSIAMRDVLVVALGDSFISGEGNPDVPADLTRLKPTAERREIDWPTSIDSAEVDIAEWWDEPCHRTLLSWPVTATLAWAADDPQRAVTLVHTGCSGAKIHDGLLERQQGLPGCPEDSRTPRHCPPRNRERNDQTTQIAQLIGSGGRPVDRALLSIGGNDIGFVGVIAFALLPPNGYILPDGVVKPIGEQAGVVCPDHDVAEFLREACGDRPTAAYRIANDLPSAFSALQDRLDAIGIPPAKVIQTLYPDILHREDGYFCQHAWQGEFIDRWLRSSDPEERALAQRQDAYRGANLATVLPAGFEATQTMIEPIFQGRRIWSWQFDMDPAFRCNVEPQGPADAFRDGSDVCGAFRTWVRLNEAVRDNAEVFRGWWIVSGHVAETKGHGWCRSDERYPLNLTVARRTSPAWRFWNPTYEWVFARGDLDGPAGTALRARALEGPGAYDPYDKDQPRWFRTSNDSFRTQYGGPDRIIQGTVHPTFRTHIAYAQAVLNESPPLPR